VPLAVLLRVHDAVRRGGGGTGVRHDGRTAHRRTTRGPGTRQTRARGPESLAGRTRPPAVSRRSGRRSATDAGSSTCPTPLSGQIPVSPADLSLRTHGDNHPIEDVASNQNHCLMPESTTEQTSGQLATRVRKARPAELAATGMGPTSLSGARVTKLTPRQSRQFQTRPVRRQGLS
jgi:hypothetical protein